MGDTTRLRAFYHAALAACLLLLLLGSCAAQSLTRQIVKAPTGESVQFLGDSVALKYFPAASANCSQCYLSFKLGALSELDAFGQPVVAHTIPDLSNLVPEVTGGQRVSGSVSYHYLTMTFTPGRLPQGLSKNNCPSLESIINQAYSAGVGQDNELMGQFAGQAGAAWGTGPANLVGQPTAPELAQMSPFGRRLTQFGRSWLPSFKVVSGEEANEVAKSLSSPAASTARGASPAAQPAQPQGPEPSKAADSQPQSDKPADKPAEKLEQKAAEKPEDKTANKPADKPEVKAADKPEPEAYAAEEKPADKPEGKPADTPADKPAEQPADKPADKPESKQEEKQPAPAAAPAPAPTPEPAPAPAPAPAAASKQEAPAASPSPEPVASSVAIEPPTTDQLVGPKEKPSDAPAAADKAKAEDKAPPAAPAPTPEPEKKPDSGSGLIPIPEEKDDSETPAKPTPAAAPEPAPAPAPAPQQVQPAPAVMTPLVPASQAADLWHQQLAANNGYLPNPAGAAGQAWGAYGGSSQYPAAGGSQYPAVGGGYPAGMFGDAPPSVRVTFMFGFSGNKTFAYGRGRVVSAPAGSIKYTVEAQNWPFCSLYNSLKLEVVMASTMKDAQPQFVLSDASDVFEDMDSMRGPATRKLHQSEAFTDFMEAERSLGKKGVAGVGGLDMLGLASGPTKHVSTAKLLVGPNLAAATEFPTYAFSSDRFTSESNVSVVLATSKDAARFSLTFKYFEQGLFYDPTVFFTHKDDMMLADTGVVPTAPTSLMCKNESDCVRSRRRPTLVGNSSSRPSSSLRLQVLLSAAAVLLVALIL